jgi:hypothetical protein
VRVDLLAEFEGELEEFWEGGYCFIVCCVHDEVGYDICRCSD